MAPNAPSDVATAGSVSVRTLQASTPSSSAPNTNPNDVTNNNNNPIDETLNHTGLTPSRLALQDVIRGQSSAPAALSTTSNTTTQQANTYAWLSTLNPPVGASSHNLDAAIRAERNDMQAYLQGWDLAMNAGGNDTLNGTAASDEAELGKSNEDVNRRFDDSHDGDANAKGDVNREGNGK